MKQINPRWQRLCGAILVAAASLAAPAYAQQAKLLTGPWHGVLATPSNPPQLIIHITAQPTGALDATLDVPSQKVKALAFSQVEMRQDSLILLSEFLGARFAARLSADGQQLAGRWQQGSDQWPLVLQRGQPAAAAPPARPQDPVAPLPYREQQVRFKNPQGGHELAGTLSIPPGKGPFPAVVLVSGSGPQDRDESILGHRPFLVLSDYLTRRGFLVLRYDDRGVGQSGGTFATATTADFLTDAQAALAFLRTQPGVQAKRVGLIGHSEGGTVALLAGAEVQPPAFIVSLAGMAVGGRELLLRQQADILRVSGLDTASSGRMQRTQQALLTIIQTTPDNPPAIARMVPLLKQASPGVSESALTTMATQMTSPWYRYFLGLHPASALAKVKVPVLALNGTKDVQVSADLNLEAIRSGLQKAANRDVTIQRLDGLNHLFQTATSGLPSEYGQISETFSPAALQIIGNWLAARTRR